MTDWIAWLKRLFRKPYPRRFRHVDGFGDDTQFVEVREDGSVWTFNGKTYEPGWNTWTWKGYGPDGEDIVETWTLADCEKAVRNGDWYEV